VGGVEKKRVLRTGSHSRWEELRCHLMNWRGVRGDFRCSKERKRKGEGNIYIYIDFPDVRNVFGHIDRMRRQMQVSCGM
jgi:hypothetical protein